MFKVNTQVDDGHVGEIVADDVSVKVGIPDFFGWLDCVDRFFVAR